MSTQLPCRVAILSDALPDRNGVGTYYLDLVKLLQERVDQAELFCPEGFDGRFTGRLRMPLPGDATQRLWFPHRKRLYDALADMQPDVVISATPGPFGIIGARHAHRYRDHCRLLVGIHTPLLDLTNLYWSRVQRRLNRWYLIGVYRLMSSWSEAALVHSTDMLPAAREIGAKRVELTGTPLSPKFVDAPPPAPTGSVHSVLFAGRLAAEKRLEEVFCAAEALPDLQFRIAGDGPERGAVLAAAKRLPNLEYLGWLARSQLREAIDAVDCLVLPSSVESFGTIAFEAMARRRLVVVSAACGILRWPELAVGLHAMGSRESLVGALHRLLDQTPTERAELAETARIAALSRHEDTMDHWMQLLAPNPEHLAVPTWRN